MINYVIKQSVSEILNVERPIILEIPVYQREYSWSNSQWEPFFDDLVDNKKGYFLGSIICIEKLTDHTKDREYEVIDGQQRLTTLSIFLATIYETLKEFKGDMNDDQIHNLGTLKRKFTVPHLIDQTRIVPQVPNYNLDDYKALLFELGIIDAHQPKQKSAGSRKIFRAYNYFKKRISLHLEDFNDKVLELFEILEKVNSSILVMITVSSHADAYTLFESLNDRGAPLTAIDLMKNLLLSNIDQEYQGNLETYFRQWEHILNSIGDDYSAQERFFRYNYNAFRKEMNEPFKTDKKTHPLGQVATRTNLLEIYEKIIKNNPIGFLEETSKNAMIYSSFLLRNTEKLDLKLEAAYADLSRIQGAPSYLLLLYITKNARFLDINDQTILKVVELLIKFFVRRNLTDTPNTRDLIRIFMSLIEDIQENKEKQMNNYTANKIYEDIRRKLIKASASDYAFEKVLRGPIYSTNSNATRFILCELTKEGMTMENFTNLWSFNESKRYVWTIEHIFPQGENIPDCWISMIAGGNRAKAKELQLQYVHTLGNLTLTGYNSTLGNRSFNDKKNWQDNNGNYTGFKNGLILNDDVCIESEWTINIIERRTERMVRKVKELFSF